MNAGNEPRLTPSAGPVAPPATSPWLFRAPLMVFAVLLRWWKGQFPELPEMVTEKHYHDVGKLGGKETTNIRDRELAHDTIGESTNTPHNAHR